MAGQNKKSFFKAALGSIIEIEDTGPKTPSAPPPSQNSVPVFANPSPTVAVVGTQISTADMEKFIAHFEQLMKDANLPGPDYFEFAKVMETLRLPIPDERARMVATLASLQAQNTSITKDVLLSSAQHYMSIVQQDKQAFTKTLNAQKKSEIGTRSGEIEELTQKIVSHQQQIDQLTKEMGDFSIKIQALKSELTEIDGRFNKNESGYILSSDAMVTKISGDIEKIKVYIS